MAQIIRTRNQVFNLIISVASKLGVELTNLKYEAVRDCYRIAFAHDRSFVALAIDGEAFITSSTDEALVALIEYEMRGVMEAPRTSKLEPADTNWSNKKEVES